MLAIGFQRVGLFFFSCTQFQNRECGHLSAQRLDQPDDTMDQSPKHRPTSRDCGIWAASLPRMHPYRVLHIRGTTERFLRVRFRGGGQHDIGGAQVARVRVVIKREDAGKDAGDRSHIYDTHSSSERY